MPLNKETKPTLDTVCYWIITANKKWVKGIISENIIMITIKKFTNEF